LLIICSSLAPSAGAFLLLFCGLCGVVMNAYLKNYAKLKMKKIKHVLAVNAFLAMLLALVPRDLYRPKPNETLLFLA